jgi:polyisoprenyl-teichoic acid--peptidoglycan teichoic acid transferase
VVNHSELMGSRSARRPSRRRRGWYWAVLAVAALVTAVVLYTLSMVGVAVQEMTDPVQPQTLTPEARPVPVQERQRINILAVGLDDDQLRTDTMLVVSIDPQSKQVAVLQIPRDTRAMLSGKGTYEKINGAYAFGVGDKQFPANLRALKTVEDLLDVSIHYTVVIDLDGFRQVIDKIGNVTVTIPQKMDYDDPTQDLHIHFEPGVKKLNGKEALEFVRWRHNNDGTGYPDGDLGRIRTQQQFLGILLDQMLKPANLLSLPNQLVTLSKNVSTSMDVTQMLNLTKLSASISRQDITFATLPGTDAYLLDPGENRRLSFYLPDPEATRQLVDRLIRGIDPKEAARVRVEVAATDEATAATLSSRLTSQGFASSVVRVDGPAPEKTRIIDLKGDTAQSQLVARSLASLGYTVEILSQPDGAATADVRVIIGSRVPIH